MAAHQAPPVPGILQARTLEWVAISFSNAWKWKVKVKSLSRVQLLATPWTAVHQAPPSMGFSRQEYWSGLPLPSLNVGLELSKNWVYAEWGLTVVRRSMREASRSWSGDGYIGVFSLWNFTELRMHFSACMLHFSCICAKSLQSCPTPSDPMDCSLSGSSIHWIFQARVLEWVAIAFSEWQSWVDVIELYAPQSWKYLLSDLYRKNC